MKTKLRRFVSILSAMVLMILCSVPAFADDTLSIDYVNNYPAFAKWIRNYYLSSLNINTDDYLLMFVKPSDGRIGGVFVPRNYISSNSYTPCISQKNVTTRLYYSGTVTIYSFTFVDWNNNTSNCRFSVYSSINTVSDNWFGKDSDLRVLDVCYSEFDIYDYDTRDIFFNSNASDPNAVPAPFTVTYSPDLKLNLKRKTSDYETKSIDVTLTLNQDYLDWYIRRYAEMKLNVEVGKLDSESIEAILGTKNLAEVFDLTGCGKSKCIYFISLSDPSKPLRTVTQNSVYTYLSQQRYSIVDKDNGDIDGSTSTAVYANGLYPYFTVDFKEYFKHTMQSDIASENCSYKKYQAVVKNLPSYQLSIPLENIDAEKFEVISVLNSILTCETLFPTESGQSVFDDSFKSAYSVDRGPKGVSFNNIDYVDVDKWDTDDTGYLDYFSKSDCYTVYSEKFSFDSYPKYVPLKDGKGNDINMIKTNPFDYSMHPVKPGTYQSVGQDGTLSDERTEEEQKKYDEDVKKAQNFSNVDFGIDGIKSIFDGTSVFYSFLTASIAILPNYFLIILGSFFVCMLAICVVKWVLK